MHTSKDNSKQRQLGAYYTPQSISDLLSEWAISSPNDSVLEPSFGGCGFIDSLKSVFTSKGQNHPEKRIWGCDIDPCAFDYLSNSLGPILVGYHQRFLHMDFLKTNRNSFSHEKFDVVIGNPPYLGHHNLTKSQKDTGCLILDEHNVLNNKTPRANLWYYFVLHSLSFLKTGGRIAFILPANFTKAGYAKPLQEIIDSKFKNKKIIYIKDQLFRSQGTKERVCILLADNWSHDTVFNTKTEYLNASSLDALNACINKKAAIINQISKVEQRFSIKTNILSMLDLTILDKLSGNKNSKRLSNFCDIKIGIVTGDSKYFVLNREQVALNKLNEKNHVKPILTSLSNFSGIQIKANDINALIASNKKCLLLNPLANNFKSINFRNYIHSYPEKLIASNKTFKKRCNWYEPDDNNIPDAFMPYMSKDGPRLILNAANINCTNNIHRIYFNKSCNVKLKKMICISMLSSYTQIIAELISRYYGSGLLKTEPGEAKRLEVLMPSKVTSAEVNKVFNIICKALVNKDHVLAQTYADRFVFQNCFSELDADYYIKKLTDIHRKLKTFRQ